MTAPEMEIQQEIERTREHLGDTVAELAAATDVRARARAKATEMKDRATGAAAGAAAQLRQRRLTAGSVPGRHEAPRRWPFAAAAAGAVVIGSVLVRRRRRGGKA